MAKPVSYGLDAQRGSSRNSKVQVEISSSMEVYPAGNQHLHPPDCRSQPPGADTRLAGEQSVAERMNPMAAQKQAHS
jgi:hypothetical protein